MIALPSIAFGGFSGSAKGVTARQVGGRSILSVKGHPTGPATNAQVVRRASLSKITKSYRLLSESQMQEWDRLAEHASGKSVLGQKAQLTGINLFVRLNANRRMVGESLIMDAPASINSVPNVDYTQVWATPSVITFKGITHQTSPNKLVVKMSASQSPGVSSGWNRTVIIADGLEDDWGEADVTTLYMKTLGVSPVAGQKIFIETYWLDTETGFTGQVFKDSVIVMSSEEAGEAGFQSRKRVTLEGTVPEKSHVSAFNLDFSTGAPVVNHEAVLLGHSNIASSEIVLEEMLDAELIGTSLCIGRGAGEDGNIKPQSYIVWLNNSSGAAKLTYGHRGGDYVRPTEVFGPGIIF